MRLHTRACLHKALLDTTVELYMQIIQTMSVAQRVRAVSHFHVTWCHTCQFRTLGVGKTHKWSVEVAAYEMWVDGLLTFEITLRRDGIRLTGWLWGTWLWSFERTLCNNMTHYYYPAQTSSSKCILNLFPFPALIFHVEEPHYKKMDNMVPACFYVKSVLCKQLALCALVLSSLSGSPAGLAHGTLCAGSCWGRDWLCVNKATDTDWLTSWSPSQNDGRTQTKGP